MASYTFRPGLVPTLAAVLTIGLMAWLGNWQMHRADGKRAMEHRLDTLSSDSPVRLPSSILSDAEHYQFRRVEAQGTFLPHYQILLDNQVRNGVPGYDVVTPLRLEGSAAAVLVNRGWIPAGLDRKRLPVVPTEPGSVHVEGIAIIPSRKYLELSKHTVEGPVWENLAIERYRQAVPFPVQPVVILQQNDAPDGLVRQWPRPDAGVTMHLGYAFQWYTLAATVAVVYLVVNLKRLPEENHDAH